MDADGTLFKEEDKKRLVTFYEAAVRDEAKAKGTIQPNPNPFSLSLQSRNTPTLPILSLSLSRLSHSYFIVLIPNFPFCSYLLYRHYR